MSSPLIRLIKGLLHEELVLNYLTSHTSITNHNSITTIDTSLNTSHFCVLCLPKQSVVRRICDYIILYSLFRLLKQMLKQLLITWMAPYVMAGLFTSALLVALVL